MTWQIKPYRKRLYRVFRDRRIPAETNFPASEATKLETDIEHALSNFSFCWSDKKTVKDAYKEKSRFSDGSWPVLYTAEDCETAVTEVMYHLNRIAGTAYDDGELMSFNLVQYSVNLVADVACFENADVAVKKQLTSDTDKYEFTNDVAKNVKAANLVALRSLSARRHSAFCVPIFSPTPVVPNDTAITIKSEMSRGQLNFSSWRKNNKMELTIQEVSQEV